MNPNKPSPPRSPWGAAPPTPSLGPRTSGEADLDAPITWESDRPPRQGSSPASSAAPFLLDVFVGPGQSTLVSVQLSGTPTGGGKGAAPDRRLEEVALGWRKAACGPASGRGQLKILRKGRSSHQLSGGQTRPLLSSPVPLSSLFPPPASLSSLSPQADSPRVKGQAFLGPASSQHCCWLGPESPSHFPPAPTQERTEADLSAPSSSM